jgi:hypothetical protein
VLSHSCCLFFLLIIIAMVMMDVVTMVAVAITLMASFEKVVTDTLVDEGEIVEKAEGDGA